MRTVYADEVFALNFFVDYFLLKLCFSSLHINIKKRRLLTASSFGAAAAVVFAILNSGLAVKLLYSLLCLVIMLCLCIGKKHLKIYIKAVLTAYVISFILCGILNLFVNSYNCKNVTVLTVIGISVLCFLHRMIVHMLSNNVRVEYFDAEIELHGISLRTKLLCDSGNLLVDPYTLFPIIVIDNGLLEIYSIPLEKTRLVPVDTVIGSSFIKVVTPESIKILKDNRKFEMEAVLGFADVSGVKQNGYDGIVPMRLVDNI